MATSLNNNDVSILCLYALQILIVNPHNHDFFELHFKSYFLM